MQLITSRHQTYALRMPAISASGVVITSPISEPFNNNGECTGDNGEVAEFPIVQANPITEAPWIHW